MENLVKRYATGSKNAVDGISFEVRAGELFCFLGVNGAGKSTTINIICTLVEKTSGEVHLSGFTLGKNDNEIRGSIGVVFQQSVLDDVLTVEENILLRAAFYGFDRGKAKKQLGEVAERLSMTGFLNQKYEKLSGGQRRKSDIARALMAEPKILFLDEPTTGLDPKSRIELWETIEDIRKESKMTVFLTTHYMEETDHADRVAIIDRGKIIAMDTPQRLKTEFSTDTLKLVVKEGRHSEMEKILNGRKPYRLVADTYHLNMKNGLDAIDFLPEVKPYLDSFEMEKGNMDSVFLNVVGRTME